MGGTQKNILHDAGFGLVETVVGTAIISLIMFSIIQVAHFTVRVVDGTNFRLRASYLAEEGIEVARLLRDSSWTTNIAPLSVGTDYYLTFSSGTWQLGTVPVSQIDGIFTRRINFSAVSRNTSGPDIDEITTTGGAVDPDTKKITVSVSWINRAQTATITLSTYLTNLLQN